MKYNIVPPYLYNFEAYFINSSELENQSVISLYFEYMSSLDCSCNVSIIPSRDIENEIKTNLNGFKLICFYDNGIDDYSYLRNEDANAYFSKIMNVVKNKPQSDNLTQLFRYDFRNFGHSNNHLLLISVDNSILPSNRPTNPTRLNCQTPRSQCLDQKQERTWLNLKLIFQKEIGFIKKKNVVISELRISLYLFHNFRDIGISFSPYHNEYNLYQIE